MTSPHNSYAVIFPNEPNQDLNLLPWRFQQIVSGHRQWLNGLMISYFRGIDAWVVWITPDTFDHWKHVFDTFGAILALQKKPTVVSDDEKYYNKTGLRR